MSSQKKRCKENENLCKHERERLASLMLMPACNAQMGLLFYFEQTSWD